MNGMIAISLALNIAILVPVCTGLIGGAVWADDAYGDKSPARSILLSVYMAILILSCALLIWKNPTAVAMLLLVQVVYKIVTPFAVGSISHPVVLTNLAVAAFHSVTLYTIWQSAGRQPSI